jgi:hypothetical protein
MYRDINILMFFNALINVLFTNALFVIIIIYKMYNIMFVDLENPIVFKLKKLDQELQKKRLSYNYKQKQIEKIFIKIKRTIELYEKTFKNIDKTKVINKEMIENAKQIYINILKKEYIVKRYAKILNESQQRLINVFIQKKRQVVYDICQQIKNIINEIDYKMQVNIFTSIHFKKNNFEINIEEICKQFAFKHYLAYGHHEAADNQLIFELRNYIKKNYLNNNNHQINIYLLSSDRTLIIYSTYQYINKVNINFNILIQEKCCSNYLLSSIKYYNKIDKATNISNIKLLKIDNFNLNDINKIEKYAQNNNYLKLTWKPWIPGTEQKKKLQEELCIIF